jgi:hypothetical protein
MSMDTAELAAFTLDWLRMKVEHGDQTERLRALAVLAVFSDCGLVNAKDMVKEMFPQKSN